MNALIAALVSLISVSGNIASEGDVDEPIPSIEGWDEATFVTVMQSFRRKERDNVAMQTIAAALDDEQMAALAAYFAARYTD